MKRISLLATSRLATRKVLPAVQKPEGSRPRWSYCNGQVVGPNHKGLPGACVFVAGNRTCITATDADGWFTLRVPATASCALTIAYSGLAEQHVVLSADNCVVQVPVVVRLAQ